MHGANMKNVQSYFKNTPKVICWSRLSWWF